MEGRGYLGIGGLGDLGDLGDLGLRIKSLKLWERIGVYGLGSAKFGITDLGSRASGSKLTDERLGYKDRGF